MCHLIFVRPYPCYHSVDTRQASYCEMMKDFYFRSGTTLTPEQASRCPEAQQVDLVLPPCSACTGTDTATPPQPTALQSAEELQRTRELLLTQLGVASRPPRPHRPHHSTRDLAHASADNSRGALIDQLARAVSEDSDTFRGGVRWARHTRRRVSRISKSSRTASPPITRHTPIHRRRSSQLSPRTRRDSRGSSSKEIMSLDHIYRVAKRRFRHSPSASSRSSPSAETAISQVAVYSEGGIHNEKSHRPETPTILAPATTSSASSDQGRQTFPTISTSPRSPPRAGRRRADAIDKPLNRTWNWVMVHSYNASLAPGRDVTDEDIESETASQIAQAGSEDEEWEMLPLARECGGGSGTNAAALKNENVFRPANEAVSVRKQAHEEHSKENVRPAAQPELGGQTRKMLGGEGYAFVGPTSWTWKRQRV